MGFDLHGRGPFSTDKPKKPKSDTFEEIFPSNEAALTVGAGPSIACSSPVAFRWSKEFEKTDDPSGRAVSIHDKAVKTL